MNEMLVQSGMNMPNDDSDACSGESDGWYDEDEEVPDTMTEEERLQFLRRPRTHVSDISEDYCNDNWKPRDGIRELMQNWIDGCIQVSFVARLSFSSANTQGLHVQIRTSWFSRKFYSDCDFLTCSFFE